MERDFERLDWVEGQMKVNEQIKVNLEHGWTETEIKLLLV